MLFNDRVYAAPIAVLLHICLVPFGSTLADEAASSNVDQRPNVLFIAVDDLRPELDCYGAKTTTPNIDRLAEAGLLFERAYSNQAVCGASRVSLMTSLYPEFTGERTYHVTDWRKRWQHIVTLNQHFTANGYKTIGLGKIYHGSGGPGVDPDNWTEWVKVDGKGYADPASWRNIRESRGRKRGPSTESADVDDDAYADGARAKTGAQRLRQLAKGSEPFFLAVGFTKPHLPFNAPTKYWDLYERSSFRLPDNSGRPPGYPAYAANVNAGELRSYSDVPLKGLPADFPDELNKRLLHGYHACVSYTDRNIGQLLETLEESGAAENTIVVLWADHGWKLGDHSSWCKHTNFECDTRVPLIIRHPQIETARGRTTALAELIDLYPTLCELCGLSIPDHVQGKSLLPVLKDPQADHRRAAYSSYPHRANGRKNVVGHSIRTAQHRYTEWWARDTDEVVDSVLTNIEKDPAETTAINDQPELKARLSKLLHERVLAARK